MQNGMPSWQPLNQQCEGIFPTPVDLLTRMSHLVGLAIVLSITCAWLKHGARLCMW